MLVPSPPRSLYAPPDGGAQGSACGSPAWSPCRPRCDRTDLTVRAPHRTQLQHLLKTLREHLMPMLLVDREQFQLKLMRSSERSCMGDPPTFVGLLRRKEVGEIVGGDVDAGPASWWSDFSFLTKPSSKYLVPVACAEVTMRLADFEHRSHAGSDTTGFALGQRRSRTRRGAAQGGSRVRAGSRPVRAIAATLELTRHGARRARPAHRSRNSA